ncbi:hypothetical protein [Chitinophaga sp. MM2321]|uniref:hypothetical protein n=1 Tax=Chitinophaga sp. MM2321 TaxID=3137178 RepID=UPI0032D59642
MEKVYKTLLFVFLLIISHMAYAQSVTGTFKVSGGIDKFYPVTFLDAGWNANVAPELQIGRSNVHLDSSWRGSMTAIFRFHITNWGSGSGFIDADLRQYNNPNLGYKPFIAGWRDASVSNANARIIIWLRGNTTYNYTCTFNVSPVIYDGVLNPLPFQEVGGPAHSFKTTVDTYVNTMGSSYNHSAYFNGGGLNYFAGSVGIGTLTTGPHKLAVEGTIGARKVKVQQSTWADYVFHPEYQLPSLTAVEEFILDNKHLPGIPSEAEVNNNGIDLGDMDKMLLQKIEELTLYMIELKKENNLLRSRVEKLEIK